MHFLSRLDISFPLDYEAFTGLGSPMSHMQQNLCNVVLPINEAGSFIFSCIFCATCSEVVDVILQSCNVT